MQKISSILGSRELNGHAHFWPCPLKNHWNSFYHSWHCTSMPKITSFHQFILEIQSTLDSCDQASHTHLWPCTPSFFWSPLNLCEFVSTCKKSGYLIDWFWRYGWLKNLAVWLTDKILAHISETKNFINMGFAKGTNFIKQI